MPELKPELDVRTRVEFPEEARELIRRQEDEITALKLKLDELSKALAKEAVEHGGTQKERDIAKEQAGLDPLTEIPNRKLGAERAEQLLKITARGDIKLALVRLDIDHFKEINDTFGHLWGDKILKAVSETLTHTKRDTDTVSRFGGEEFDILIPLDPNIDLEDIGQIVVRHLLALHNINRNDPKADVNPIRLTGSFGVAVVNSGENIDYTTISQMADDALYAAKNSGRNNIQIIEANKHNLRKDQREYLHPHLPVDLAPTF